jgi:hypothetical protein
LSRSVFTGGLPVLRLAGTVGCASTGRSLAYAVLARLAEAAQPPGTVILELTGGPAAGHSPPGPAGRGAARTLRTGPRPGGAETAPPEAGGQDGWEELCKLAGALHPCGIALRLVIAPGREHDRLLETAPGPPGPPVHPTLRAAVLATYAALPGPGLVTPGVRADLAMPAEPLSAGDGGPLFTPSGWGAAREAVGGLGSA